MDRKVLLSTLWIFVILNMIFLDVHAFFKPGFIAEIMTGVVNGTQMTPGLLLIGAILVEIPIAMVLLSRVLKYKTNRWANIIVSIITMFGILNNISSDPDKIFFGTIMIITLLYIVQYAWKWPKPKKEEKDYGSVYNF